MFCPKCAAQNLDGASFCRSCGANISLVPQALTGQLAQQSTEGHSRSERRARRKQKEASLDAAFKNAFMGIAFVFVAMALMFSRIGTGWWFWMLIPAFSLMGTGIAQYIRYREEQKRSITSGTISQPSVQASPFVNSLPSRNAGELESPPSVTEGTTRHLGADARTRVFDTEPRK